jgi:hypothetical protein
MGAFLSQPITDKETVIGEGNGLRFGMSEMQGWRTEMEVRKLMSLGYGDSKCVCISLCTNVLVYACIYIYIYMYGAGCTYSRDFLPYSWCFLLRSI